MEILLTEDEQFDAATKRSPGEMHWNNICRAQLARVVEWIAPMPFTRGCPPNMKGKPEHCHETACGECWHDYLVQALRKAAGEGK